MTPESSRGISKARKYGIRHFYLPSHIVVVLLLLLLFCIAGMAYGLLMTGVDCHEELYLL
ncbi:MULTISPECIES: hypothetical protein [Prochlorococcus]|uniref:hypothetical protein n=1 Tax=Prochlorococcus TaxID=1218 RepID=UPI000533730B|nr:MULTISPECIES: hypothetical protein [Prochlorococcus]KGG14209.1 hypothetical protein EV05_0100 [Prochlorococcus sp. MIT 0601]